MLGVDDGRQRALGRGAGTGDGQRMGFRLEADGAGGAEGRRREEDGGGVRGERQCCGLREGGRVAAEGEGGRELGVPGGEGDGESSGSGRLGLDNGLGRI